MLLVFQLAARNALRNKRRSALTATTVLLGTALLTVALAWINGVMGSFLSLGVQAVGEVRVINQEYVKREQLSPRRRRARRELRHARRRARGLLH